MRLYSDEDFDEAIRKQVAAGRREGEVYFPTEIIDGMTVTQGASWKRYERAVAWEELEEIVRSVRRNPMT